ncbi:MAG: putative rane protein, partial [Mycobacterium sp.]|nr:putative rane protein [Mycobacterium sp.]
VTLALRALPAAGRGDPPGMREWLLAALHSKVSKFLTHPIVALVLFVAGFYGLYFGGLFDAAADSHAAHVAMNVHVLLSGDLFYWVVIGVDPTPRPIPPLAKLGIVFASLPLHAFFGVVLMGTKSLLAGDFYESLGLPWHTDLVDDQKLGGAIAWSAGEVARRTATTTPTSRHTTRCSLRWPSASPSRASEVRPRPSIPSPGFIHSAAPSARFRRVLVTPRTVNGGVHRGHRQ